ncbi:Panacea domain-containing protein [Bartonella sp. cb54]|uniref:Panacea domain-containing protein n=1 Tax=Bartonella sp. cb54 TaxID=3385560 RepID=UPI0039A61D4D
MNKVQKNGIFTVQQVANFFLNKGNEGNIEISPMKLIKLVYFAYGWVLAITNKRLFSDPIEAWDYGPVIPVLYYEFRSWGKNPINCTSYTRNFETGEVDIPNITENSKNKDIIRILEAVWNTYKSFSSWELSNESHSKGSPWEKVYKKGYNIQLIDDHISNYFLKEIKK